MNDPTPEMIDAGLKALRYDLDNPHTPMGQVAIDIYRAMEDARAKVTEQTTATRPISRGRLKIDRHWQPSPALRWRRDAAGMILEQLFLGTSFGQPTISEWRPVPMIPESEAEHAGR